MEGRKKNWLTGSVVIILIAVVLFAIFYSSGKQKDVENDNKKTPTVSGNESENQTGSSLQDYMDEQDSIMAKMMEGMKAVQESGNASVHFLKGMIPHHEAAIEMAESYLNHGGQNDALKKLAENIINAQTKEIEDMNTMIKQIEDSGKKDTGKEASYLSEYDKMMQTHEHGEHTSHGTPANVEQAFAEGMIMHHQMAIDMSQAILTYTDEDDVKSLAQAIIETQKKEIQEMQDIIKNLEPAA